ncbi:MAG: hemerythrin family protein [Holophagaceae bacterium]|nr:hemerythrin family protein [Holophagaceae bacterium]
MALAQWKDEYATGIAVIDAQHQRLFEAINRMEEAFKVGTQEDEAKESLAFLARYTKEHFDTEEAFMRELAYPMLAFHQEEHAALVAKIQVLQRKVDEDLTIPAHMADFAAHMANFAADWLAHHINEADMGYVQFARERPAL